MKMIFRARISVLLALIIVLLSLCACAFTEVSPRTGTQSAPPATETTVPPAPIVEPPPLSLTFVAVGDNLIHNTVFQAAKVQNGYDFTPMYAPVRGLIQSADIAFVNQEAPLATDLFAASGYPNFNTPQEAGRDLLKTGFDIINQANNHAMDRGYKAVLSTVAFWKGQDEGVMIGMYENEGDRTAPCIVEKNGIKLGLITYTYGTNGIPIPGDRPYLVPLIDRERIKADIVAVRDRCDVLIASMHWGVEYNLGVTDEQQALALFLTEQGVDLIVGHHPHVIEPAQWIQAENGNNAFCVYSLGNFISSQQRRATMLGGMLRVTIEKASDNTIRLIDPGVLPIVTHYEKTGKNYGIYPLYDYSDELAKKHAVNQYDKSVSMDYLTRTAQEVLGDFAIFDR